MNLDRTENPIDRLEREKVNKNWSKIESSFNNIVDVVAEQAFNQVVEQASLIWQEPVDTVADLTTTYPNPDVGWTAMTLDDGKVYRWSGSSWEYKMEINPTQISAVNNELKLVTQEATGYGVLEGLLVEPQTWPIRNMTGQMSAGVAYFQDGLRVESSGVGVIPFDNSDATLMRKDIVCIDRNGDVSVVKGANAAGNPPIPPTPPDTILLAIVTIKAGSTAIDTTTVQDKREFKYNNNELTAQIENANNSNALSIRPSEGIITRMLNNAQSYVRRSNLFAYGAPTAFYPGPIFIDGNGKFRMNCSTFGHLMQKGIPFENSKYNMLSENIVDPNFNDMIQVDDDLFTYDFAKWAFDNGYGYYPEEDFSNVVAGDMLFFSWSNPAAQLPMHDASFMNLDHTAMFVETNPDGSFLTYEDGNLPAMSTYPSSYRSQVKYCCRLPFTAEDLKIENLAIGGTNTINSIGRSVVNTYRLNKPLEQHKWYTVTIKADIQTAGCWFNIISGSSLLYTGRLHGITENGMYTFHFCTRGLTLQQDVTLSLVAESEASVPTNTRNCVVNWFVLTPGFTNSIKEPVDGGQPVSTPTFTFTNGFTGISHLYRNGGVLTLNIRVTNPSTIPVGGLVDIGNLSGTTLRTVINVAGSGFKELNATPSYDTDLTTWVSAVEAGSPPYRVRLKNGDTDPSMVTTLNLNYTLPIN